MNSLIKTCVSCIVNPISSGFKLKAENVKHKDWERGKAFTIAELVIVITILIILSTMGFISVKDYLKDGRDAKRLSDINSLYTKIASTQVLGASIEDLIIPLSYSDVTINGSGTTSTLGTANREALKELRDSFLDPNSTENNPIEYEIAYINGVAEFENLSKKSYNFLELRTKLEVTDEYAFYGDYTKIKSDSDSGNLFGNAGTFLVPPKACPIYTTNNYTIQGASHGAIVTATKKVAIYKGNLLYQQKFQCRGGDFFPIDNEAYSGVECTDTNFVGRSNQKICVLVCEDTNNPRSWARLMETYQRALGSYTGPIWDDNTLSYIYPDGRTADDYPAFKACTDLGPGWRMPKTSEIGEITGAISDGTTCKSILNSIYSKDSVKILAAEAPGAGVGTAYDYPPGGTSPFGHGKTSKHSIYCIHN